MASHAPRTELRTHSVTNQPPPYQDVNLYTHDLALQDAVSRNGTDWAVPRLEALGARAGSAEVADWAFEANRNRPELVSFDRYGRRLDEVRFHPAYHALMALGLEAGLSSAAWQADAEGRPAGHTAHAALLFLMAQAEPSVVCPMTMTYAAVPALRAQPDTGGPWIDKILAGGYDPAFRPMAEKTAVTIGMAMTEKQGGSDVRANTTRAEPLDGGGPGAAYALTGHKWFCSAPMCDAFLTLAQTPGGLSCFLVPRWRPDGTRNVFLIQRLKDKLGDRANASSEIEYDGTYAEMIGEDGRGVRTIIEMVHHTRLDTVLAPAALMRQALAHALWHCAHRTAFQRRLIDQPLMRRVLGDLVVESEAATALAFRAAAMFDTAGTDETEALLMRLVTPVAKYWLNKRVVPHVHEAMETLGGAGYIEEGIMPRIYRQAPLNGIWEGSGNVICLDILRAVHKTPAALDAVGGMLEAVRGRNGAYDAWLDALTPSLAAEALTEPAARQVAERLALALQAAVLLAHGPDHVADAFCATRLADRHASFGAFNATVDEEALLKRALSV